MKILMLRWFFSVPPSDMYDINSGHPRVELPALPRAGDHPEGMPAVRGIMSSFSSENISMANPACFSSFRQIVDCPFCFALAKAGSNNPARMAMIAITTSNSINVKPRLKSLTLEGDILNNFFIGLTLLYHTNLFSVAPALPPF